MRTTFRSRRYRRCNATECVHGGQVRPGQRILRVGHNRYIHEDDIVAAFVAIERAALAARLPLLNLARSVGAMGAGMGIVVQARQHGRTAALAAAEHEAAARAAHLREARRVQ